MCMLFIEIPLCGVSYKHSVYFILIFHLRVYDDFTVCGRSKRTVLPLPLTQYVQMSNPVCVDMLFM
jgi:hypothetical protein